MLTVSNQLDVNKQQVLSNIGYVDDYQPSARITSLVDDYIDNYHDLIASSYSYAIRDVLSVDGNRVTVEGSVVFESGVIARLLERCEKVAVFTLTIGNHLEELVSYLAENGLVLQATVLDAVGSGAAEKLADSVQERIGMLAKAEGMVISRRFSPGYCDWEVSQQEMVFKAMKGDTAGIRLTDTCLMIPQKSVSGIIGIGSAENDVEKYNPCPACDRHDCVGRR